MIRGDSELIAKQMCGEYQVTAENLVPLHKRASKYVLHLREDGVRVRFEHIPCTRNQRADRLANEAIDVLKTANDAMTQEMAVIPDDFKCDGLQIINALKQRASDCTWVAGRIGTAVVGRASTTATASGKFRARIEAWVERKSRRKPRRMVWEATLLEAFCPEMRRLTCVRSAYDVANPPPRAPVVYDSDDPLEKLAFYNGTHACYGDAGEEPYFVAVGKGEAAPELDENMSGFELECASLFGRFDENIQGLEDAWCDEPYDDCFY